MRLCQRISVSGLTAKAAQRGRGSTQLRAASSARSRGSLARTRRLSTKDAQLMAQHQDLNLIALRRAAEQDQQSEDPAKCQIEEWEHASPPLADKAQHATRAARRASPRSDRIARDRDRINAPYGLHQAPPVVDFEVSHSHRNIPRSRTPDTDARIEGFR